MEEVSSTSTLPDSSFQSSIDNKIEKLLDIPFHTRVANNLKSLYNYFDIYAPRMNFLYNLVTILRFFQLFGISLMATNENIFTPGTLTYRTIGIISIFYNYIPLQKAHDYEEFILIGIDIFLLIFALYLVITAFHYKKTSKVSKANTIILSIFIAICPFLFMPVVSQFVGEILSNLISKTHPITHLSLIAIGVSIITIGIYFWMMIATYSSSLAFRPISFPTLEGSAQNKLYVCTTVISYFCSIPAHMTKLGATVLVVMSVIAYCYLITTLFNCGTFINLHHQTLVLGGSMLSIIMCAVNLYPLLTDYQWNEIFFVIFFGSALVCFIIANFIIKGRTRKDLRLLDEIETLNSIDNIRNKGKFKQLLISGFNMCHPACLNFSIFKLAIQKWNDAPDIWGVYAKFAAIFPELDSTLLFINQNVELLKTKSSLVHTIKSSIESIVSTRESKFTPQVKSKLSKIAKQMTKTRNRLRNIWDLILQGASNQMDNSVQSAYKSVIECESEMNYLLTLYPNNRFTVRQYAKFLLEVKCDVISYKKCMDDVGRLQRGMRICPDVVHELGISAFPTLPDSSIEVQEMSIKSTTAQTENDINDETSFDDETNLSEINTLNKQIVNHKVPAIQFIYRSTILIFTFLFLVPCIGFSVFYFVYSNELKNPINYMQGIAFTRNLVNMLPAWVGKLLLFEMENPDDPDSGFLKDAKYVDGFTFISYGNNTDVRSIIQYLCQNVANAVAIMSPLRHFKFGNKFIEDVRTNIFGRTNYFYTFLNNHTFDKSPAASVQVAYMLASNIGKLLEYDRMTIEIARGPESLNSRNNNNIITSQLTNAILSMISFIQDEYFKYQKIFVIALVTICAINIISYFILYVIQYRKLQHNKRQVIKIFMDLPKTVVSSVSQSFNSLKDGEKDNKNSSNNDNELTRQEESIIKLFSSISDSVASNSQMINMIFFLFIVSISLVCFYLIYSYYKVASNKVFYDCNHINYLYGSITFLYSICARLWKIVLDKAHPSFTGTIVNITDEAINIERIISFQSTYFNSFNLGGADVNEVPFRGNKQAIEEANELLKCTDFLTPPETIPDSLHCLSATHQLYYTTAKLKKITLNMLSDPPIWPRTRGDGVNDIWQVGPVEMYEAYFYPTGVKLVPSMRKNIDDQGYNIIKVSCIFAVINLIFMLSILISTRIEEIFIKFALSQLLRCPASTILNNKKIVDFLSGDYSNEDTEHYEKHVNFSNQVVNKLDDVVIVTQDETGLILSVNNSFMNLFSMNEVSIQNKMNIRDFFIEKFGETESNTIYTQTSMVIYTKKDGSKVYLEFSSNLVSGNRIYFARDQTQNVLHEKLIEDEKKKSDAMLASILPPMLVSRVQSGEKNISFSVQSVTVLFLDVVEFTPWCGSHDAQYVMRMLNIMFKEFDSITNSHKTMTKIKCIGDCYMAAGGIFDEVNQPAIHAKEVVDFGCKVINKLLEIDERENEKLRIRVGVNTGGPIVAGVIGTEKPTFEILGPAINIAHEMEHHGVAMKVHISRPVYELIYGQQFDIKERGEIDVKGGKMFTYLVEP